RHAHRRRNGPPRAVPRPERGPDPGAARAAQAGRPRGPGPRCPRAPQGRPRAPQRHHRGRRRDRPRHRRKGPRMSRLSFLAVSKRSVTLLLAVALFLGGISAWTSLKQELLPDIAFPVITVVAPYPGVGAQDVTSQVAQPIERAISNVPRLANLQ